MLELEVDATLVRQVGKVSVPDQVQAELLAVLLVTVELVERRRGLIVLMISYHLLNLRILGDQLWRVVLPLGLLLRRTVERIWLLAW